MMKKQILFLTFALFFSASKSFAQSSIEGIVYEDVNSNGVFEAGLDNLLQGVQVALIQDDNFLDFTNTDDLGQYRFNNLGAGAYTVTPDPLPSVQLVFPLSYDLDLGPNQNAEGNDFRIVGLENFARITGLVFYDLDGDGQQNNLEPGIQGVMLTLTGPENVNLTTGPDGFYNSGYIIPGDYELTLISMIPSAELTSLGSFTLNLEAGIVTMADPFTFRPIMPFSIVTGQACYDFDADGVNDPVSEPGIHLLLVELFDGSGAFVADAFTSPEGEFSFGPLMPGSYTVSVATIPDGTVPTTPVTYTITVTPKVNPDPLLFYFDTVEPLFKCGMAVSTCFSGINTNSAPDPTRDVVVGFDIRNQSGATPGSNWGTASSLHHPQWIAAELGEVFGLAIDSDYNVYVASSTLYGLNNGFGSAGAPAIYQLDAFSGAVSSFVIEGAYSIGSNTIPNSGSAFGNICYDRDHDQLFATNMEDGMIYRIDMSGNILSRFDPITITNPADADDPEFVALKERTWAVAYNHIDSQLYFSVWNEDFGRSDDTLVNEIYAIGLDASGEFNGASTAGDGTISGNETLEICIVEAFQTVDTACMTTLNCVDTVLCNPFPPISDLAFSEAGQMLVGQRTMSGNYVVFPIFNPGNPAGNWAHRSKVLEYENIAGEWHLTPGHNSPFNNPANLKFRIGASSRNSAGGVDYGYKSFDPAEVDIPECDSMVWSTGDALVFDNFTGTYIYGLQGMHFTGGVVSNSILIDQDLNTSSTDKAQLGDVEIFKCGCPIPCENVTDAGTIGFDQIICGPGADPDPIIELTAPSGGTGAIEYLWLQFTDSNPFWTPIPGSNSPDYDPGPLSEKTYFIRCARRENCGTYLETNSVVVDIDDIAVATIEGPQLVCVNESVTFTSTGTTDADSYTWEFGPGVFPSVATGETATATFVSIGSFEVELTVVKDGCTSVAVHSVTVTTGPVFCGSLLNESGEEPVGRMTIFPNPAKAVITIQMAGGSDQPLPYRIVNSLGSIQGSGWLSAGNQSWNLNSSALPEGIYLLEVMGSDGKRYVEKFVKQN